MGGGIKTELKALGFEKIGRFEGGSFFIEPGWRRRRIVYVWTASSGAASVPLRVGIACGKTGCQSRYGSYNSWLAGRFKPHVPYEQEKRRLFLLRLNNSVEVWAREVSDRQAALAQETALRNRWGSALALDPVAKGSWSKDQLRLWREASPADSGAAYQRSDHAPSSQRPFRWLPPVPQFLSSARGLVAIVLWVLWCCLAVYWLIGATLWFIAVAANRQRGATT